MAAVFMFFCFCFLIDETKMQRQQRNSEAHVTNGVIGVTNGGNGVSNCKGNFTLCR